MRSLLAAAALLLTLPAAAGALGPGDLDESFGTEGVVFTPLGPLVAEGTSSAGAREVVGLDDGRLLAAGSAPDRDGRRAIALARYRPDGTLDRSYGDDGSVVLQLGTTADGQSAAAALAPAPGGGAVVAGHATAVDGTQAVAIARIDATGATEWAIVQQLGTGDNPASVARDVAVGDGRVLVAGRASTAGPGGAEPFVAQLTLANGVLDPAFAGTGYVIDPVDRSSPGEGCELGAAEAGALLLRDGGRVVVGGTVARTCSGASADRAFLRAYTEAGGQDPSFAAPVAGLSAFDTLLGGGADDRILAAGRTGDAPGLARFDAQGALDETFLAPDGFGAVPGHERGTATGLARQDDGRLVTAVDGPEDADHVVRVTASGERDERFSQQGLVAAGVRAPRGLALLGDGDVVVAGERSPLHGKDEQGFVLVRLHGGDTVSRLRIGGRARLKEGAAQVKLRCVGGPGCQGVLSGPQLGQVAYDLDAGARRRIAVPVAEHARKRSRVAIRATNPPAPRLSRRISLR